jgi:hypothetical protein
MTPLLPSAVVRRYQDVAENAYTDAVSWGCDSHEAARLAGQHAVFEFLRIIDERGLRIVPVEKLTQDMQVAGLVALVECLEKDQAWWREECGSDQMPIEGLTVRNSEATDSVYQAAVRATPPLAELLQDRP